MISEEEYMKMCKNIDIKINAVIHEMKDSGLDPVQVSQVLGRVFFIFCDIFFLDDQKILKSVKETYEVSKNEKAD